MFGYKEHSNLLNCSLASILSSHTPFLSSPLWQYSSLDIYNFLFSAPITRWISTTEESKIHLGTISIYEKIEIYFSWTIEIIKYEITKTYIFSHIIPVWWWSVPSRSKTNEPRQDIPSHEFTENTYNALSLFHQY